MTELSSTIDYHFTRILSVFAHGSGKICSSEGIVTAGADGVVSLQYKHYAFEQGLPIIGTQTRIFHGIPDIIHGLQHTMFVACPSHPLNRKNGTIFLALTGSDEGTQRKIKRALKRVLLWKDQWCDTHTPVHLQLQHPTCGILLFDKKIKQRNMRYICDYTVLDAKGNTHITCADIILVMYISKWLLAFSGYRSLLLHRLPNLIAFTRRIRSEFKQLLAEEDVAEALQHWIQSGLDSLWIDDSIDPVAAATTAESSRKLHSGVVAVATEADVAADMAADEAAPVLETHQQSMDAVASELVATTHWILPDSSIESSDSKIHADVGSSISFDSDEFWEALQLPEKRRIRKIQQIRSMVSALLASIPAATATAATTTDATASPSNLFVEFCAGGGYVGLSIATLLPNARVILTDRNSISLAFAQQRFDALKLTNVILLNCDLSDIEHAVASHNRAVIDVSTESLIITAETLALLRSFDCGIALHACGAATDAVLRICRSVGASFVVAPCCYGFLQQQHQQKKSNVLDADNSSRPSTCGCSYPQSQLFRASGWQPHWFGRLCSRADRTYWEHDCRAGSNNSEGRWAMKVVDADRLLVMQEAGYLVHGTFMSPLDASTKNHVLVGVRIV